MRHHSNRQIMDGHGDSRGMEPLLLYSLTETDMDN